MNKSKDIFIGIIVAILTVAVLFFFGADIERHMEARGISEIQAAGTIVFLTTVVFLFSKVKKK